MLNCLKNIKMSLPWSYDNLKTYDTSVIEHNIPLKHGIKPFRQKLRQIKPYSLNCNRKRGQETPRRKYFCSA
jgi:hypothetical protein